MKNEMLILIEKHTGALIKQTKTTPQKTLQFKLTKEMETFSFSPPINLIEEGKWLLPVTCFEATSSVFFITDENNTFSIIIPVIPGHWSSRGSSATVFELRELLKFRGENDFQLHVEEVKKKGNQIKIRSKEYELSELDTRKNEIIEDIKKTEYEDLKHIVFRLELPYGESDYLLDMKYTDASTTGYILPPGISLNSDNNLMLKSLLPDEVKVIITTDDFKLKSSFTTNKTKVQ